MGKSERRRWWDKNPPSLVGIFSIIIQTNLIRPNFRVSLVKMCCVVRDEIDLMSLHNAGCLRLTLVDHHVLPPRDRDLASSVEAVLDHRPPDPAWSWPRADVTLRTVGSCCTLVAERLLSQAPQLLSPVLAEMLLGTVLSNYI